MNMKKIIFIGTALVLCTLSTTSCQKEKPLPQISLDIESISIATGEVYQLTAKIYPEAEAVWSSSNEDVAEVNNKGLVKGNLEGVAEISVLANGIYAICKVTVGTVNAESIAFETEKLDMDLGDFKVLKVAVSPEESLGRITWQTSDSDIVSVTTGGEVNALSEGTAVITASIGDASTSCEITVTEDGYGLGDYFYSDGTCSETFDSSKECIGLVFWTGDPTEHDPALKREHPECTHGLVVGLDEVNSVWMSDESISSFATAYPEYDGDISMWCDANAAEYESIYALPEEGSNLDRIIGYNNTAAVEKFHNSPDNVGWQLEAVEHLTAYRDNVPTPESSSGWYIPSLKEMSLMVSGETDSPAYNIPFAGKNMRMKYLLNEKLRSIDDAVKIDSVNGILYWACNETAAEVEHIKVWCRLNASRGSMGSDIAYSHQNIRFILAF